MPDICTLRRRGSAAVWSGWIKETFAWFTHFCFCLPPVCWGSKPHVVYLVAHWLLLWTCCTRGYRVMKLTSNYYRCAIRSRLPRADMQPRTRQSIAVASADPDSPLLYGTALLFRGCHLRLYCCCVCQNNATTAVFVQQYDHLRLHHMGIVSRVRG